VIRDTLLARPRRAPGRTAPIVAGGALILVALPIFLVAGWSMKAWLLAAVLWAASEALGIALQRMRLGMANLGSSGVVAFGMMFRAIAVMVVLIAVAASHPHTALAAALLYAAAYTLELGVSLLAYFSGPEQ
jgi:hypothetical protein